MTRARLLPSLLAIITVAVIAGETGVARASGRSESPPQGKTPPATTAATLSGVTIEGEQSRRELRQQVNHFVESVVVRSFGDSLVRWNTPVCAVVEGLSPDSDAVILTHLSQTATAAHARLGGKHCRTNLYVIASDQPDSLLKDLWAHTPSMFYQVNGLAGVERYLHSDRPVRAWYNIDRDCRDGPGSASPASAALMSTPLADFVQNSQGLSVCSGGLSHLSLEGVQSISSAIIVADTGRTKNVTIGQLADYVAMIALADIDLDADIGTAPTILRLFQGSELPPQGLSAWDRAFLYSLYNTTQSNTMQVATVEATVMKRLSSTAADH